MTSLKQADTFYNIIYSNQSGFPGWFFLCITLGVCTDKLQ